MDNSIKELLDALDKIVKETSCINNNVELYDDLADRNLVLLTSDAEIETYACLNCNNEFDIRHRDFISKVHFCPYCGAQG